MNKPYYTKEYITFKDKHFNSPPFEDLGYNMTMHVYKNSVSYIRNANFRLLVRPGQLSVTLWVGNKYIGDSRGLKRYVSSVLQQGFNRLRGKGVRRKVALQQKHTVAAAETRF